MAFVDFNTQIPAPTNGSSPGANFIYNVDGSVGPNCANRPDDVMLVQYFLNRVYARGTVFTPPLSAPPAPGSISIDGIFGPITSSWINAFQQMSLSRGHPTAQDGRVDKSPPGGNNGVVQFTIFELNQAFLDGYPEILFSDIADNDPSCPPGLQTLFSSANAAPSGS